MPVTRGKEIGSSGDNDVAFRVLYIPSLFGDDLLVAVQGRANRLWFGDNLEVLQGSIADESVDLVYLDPPFNSSRVHNVIFEKHPDDFEAVAAQIRAFNDTWHWSPATDYLYQRYALAEGLPGPAAAALRALHGLLPEGDTMAYLVHMAPRLAELHRVLKPSGSLYLHCDPAMSHYLRLLLDAVFGAANFRNEIIWKRSSAHNSARAAGLPPEEAEVLLARARPAPGAPEPEAPGTVAPPPVYVSWEDFLDRTTPAGRMAWCRKKALRANRPRLMSGAPDVKITGADVWAVLEAARGRCGYCGSLAVENRPSARNGQPMPWAQVGRRIGSLGHRVARFNGGSNAPGNLGWACLWCNTWQPERRPGATDRGGIQEPRR